MSLYGYLVLQLEKKSTDNIQKMRHQTLSAHAHACHHGMSHLAPDVAEGIHSTPN